MSLSLLTPTLVFRSSHPTTLVFRSSHQTLVSYLVQHEPCRLDGPAEPASVDDVELEAVKAQELAGSLGFVPALVGERSVLPAREEPELVVACLAVPDDNDDRVLRRAFES